MMTQHQNLLATQPPPMPQGLDPVVVLVLALLVVGIGVMFVLYTRAKIAQGNRERGSARAQIDAVKERAASTSETERATSEMLDLAQRLAAQLDNKAERLEQLLEQADQRIATIEALGEALVRTNGNPSPTTPMRGASSDTSDSRLAHTRYGSDRVAPGGSGEAGDEDTPSLESERLEHLVKGNTPNRDQLTSEIHRLADQGFNPVEIAQRLDEQTGKVELVLALRAKQE